MRVRTPHSALRIPRFYDSPLKFARKSRQFKKVHRGSNEKFSSGFFARFEFLHSLQVIFQFINITSALGIGKFFGGELSVFGFSRIVPFPPAAMNGLFNFIFVSVYLVPQHKLFIKNYIGGEVFIQSSRIKLFAKANEIRTLPFSLTHVSQMNSLRRPPLLELASFLWLKKLGSHSVCSRFF